MLSDHSLENEALQRWREWGKKASHTFFQMFDWVETINKHFPNFHPAPLVTRNCLIPLMRIHRWGWLSDSLYGLPFMTPGGILAPSGMSASDWDQCFAMLDRLQIGSLVVVFPPRTEIPTKLAARVDMESTHVVDLKGGWDSVWKGYTQKGRTSTRKAESLGVEVFQSKTTPDLNKHWEIIQSHQASWNPNPSPTIDFIQDLLQLRAAKLFLASCRGEIMATVLVFFHPSEVFFWQGARVSKQCPHGVVNLLYTEVLRDACQAGIPSANLGGSLGEVDLIRFKESFGARACPVPVYKRKHSIIKWVGKGPLKRSL